MYLDTKNLTAGNSNSNTAAAATAALAAPKAGRRMRKVWQPLRRLLTVGGKGRPSCQPHPNNVDLNNTQLLPQLEPLQADNSDSSKTTPDESISKFAELSLQQVHEELTQTPPPPNTPTLISSVYVEKATAQSCNACHHGRNCQHTHHSSNISDRAAHSLNVSAVSHSTPTPTHTHTSSVTPAATLWDLPLPLQYISTDNGTFFWANTQERVDDDLLHAWLCQSFSQLPGTLC
ncbi:PREDICTED: enhancer of split M2 protein [Drosophila arizonae]|uniref:Enhancer of split M2 protein n=1 Tax=Drosophila arizonae TaxID=7263 RepID=A0ABM1NLR7_DROAR|nr:PREDICTED: enhancer of split M2 protein [Drosophila arizonae]